MTEKGYIWNEQGDFFFAKNLNAYFFQNFGHNGIIFLILKQLKISVVNTKYECEWKKYFCSSDMSTSTTTNATAVEHQTHRVHCKRENFVRSMLAADLLYIHSKIIYIFKVHKIYWFIKSDFPENFLIFSQTKIVLVSFPPPLDTRRTMNLSHINWVLKISYITARWIALLPDF